MSPLGLLLFLGVSSCETVSAEDWQAFNADDESVQVEVGSEVLPPLTLELHSTTGEVVVGSAEVDPGGGPLGTSHTVIVTVNTEYAEQVGRVTLMIDSGERGVDEVVLVQDSADEGLYKQTVISQGEEGERRTDTFTVHLWSPVDSDGASADSGE